MDLQTEHWLGKWLSSHDSKVNMINEPNNNKNNNSTASSLALSAGQSLSKLLDSILSSKTFQFISSGDEKSSEICKLTEHVELASKVKSINEQISNGKSFKDELSIKHELSVGKSIKDELSFDISVREEVSLIEQGYERDTVNPDQESVFGSPLKLNKIADLTYSSPNVPLCSESRSTMGLDMSHQVSLQEARRVLQKFNRNRNSKADESMLAILCNAADERNTLMVGAHREVTEGDLRVKTFVLTMETISVSSLEEWPQVKAGKRYQMTAEYELLDPTLGLGFINLTAKWKDARGRLKITEPLSTEFSLEWSTTTGTRQSPVYKLYKELQKISLFLEALKNKSVMDEAFQSGTKSEADALIQLRELFSKHKTDIQTDKWSQDSEVPVDGLSSLLDNVGNGLGTNQLNLSPAVDMDFTDELWAVLGGCSSVQQMISCLKEVFDELQRRRLHAYVSSENSSTIANLARAAASGLAVFPPLTDLLALRLVLEVGLERLRKLYQALMVETNSLCSPAQWDEIFLQSSSLSGVGYDGGMDIARLSTQLGALEKLHTCLECVAIIDASTGSQDLAKIASVVLNSLKREGGGGNLCQTLSGAKTSSSNKICGRDSYKIPVSAAVALPELEKHQWVSMRRESVAGQISTVETFLYHMPEGLLDKPLCESGSVLRFTAQQNSLHLGSFS